MPQTAATSKIKNLAANPAVEAAQIARNIGEHWPILAIGGFFDTIGLLIPFIGIVANPLFTCVLFIYWAGKGHIHKKKNLGKNLLLGTGAGMTIEAIPYINILPTNILNAVLSIVSK